MSPPGPPVALDQSFQDPGCHPAAPEEAEGAGGGGGRGRDIPPGGNGGNGGRFCAPVSGFGGGNAAMEWRGGMGGKNPGLMGMDAAAVAVPGGGGGPRGLPPGLGSLPPAPLPYP